MSDLELWNRASVESRDAANLFITRIESGEELAATIEKALKKLRSATAAMEALQRRSVGCPTPKLGD